MIRPNVGGLDRAARVTLGVLLLPAGLVLLGGLRGDILGLLTAALGLIALVTGVTRFCPMYVPFGISTARPSRFTRVWSRCRQMMTGARREETDASGCDCASQPSASH